MWFPSDRCSQSLDAPSFTALSHVWSERGRMGENHLRTLFQCFGGFEWDQEEGERLLEDEGSNTPHRLVTFLRKEVG